MVFLYKHVCLQIEYLHQGRGYKANFEVVPRIASIVDNLDVNIHGSLSFLGSNYFIFFFSVMREIIC